MHKRRRLCNKYALLYNGEAQRKRLVRVNATFPYRNVICMRGIFHCSICGPSNESGSPMFHVWNVVYFMRLRYEAPPSRNSNFLTTGFYIHRSIHRKILLIMFQILYSSDNVFHIKTNILTTQIHTREFSITRRTII